MFHWQPTPSAVAASNKVWHTAAAESTCSHSGILACGAAVETTTTTVGARSKVAATPASISSPWLGFKVPQRWRNTVPNLVRASPSNTMNRQGVSLPWSGTRTAQSRISASWAGVGPGTVMALAEADLRLCRRFKNRGRVVQLHHGGGTVAAGANKGNRFNCAWHVNPKLRMALPPGR